MSSEKKYYWMCLMYYQKGSTTPTYESYVHDEHPLEVERCTRQYRDDLYGIVLISWRVISKEEYDEYN